MKALIVEDDITNRRVLQKYLEPHFRCDLAADGKEALDAYREAFAAGEPYNVIFLDIMMPEVDGHGVLRSIREDESSRGISAEEAVKIVMTTALDDPTNVIGAFKNGCGSYLVKPISKDTLEHELKKLGMVC